MSRPAKMQTFLWYDGNLGEALKFYAETFPGFKLHSANSAEPGGKIMTAEFSIYGHELVGMAFEGGEKFNTAISLSLTVDGQDEVDRIWDAITKDGEEGQCGWCTDAFGVSWQIIPYQFREATGNPDPAKAGYAWNAMRSMKKIVIADLTE